MPFTLLRAERRMQEEEFTEPVDDTEVVQEEQPALALTLGLLVAALVLMVLLAVYSTAIGTKPRRKKAAAEEKKRLRQQQSEQEIEGMTKWQRFKMLITLPALSVRVERPALEAYSRLNSEARRQEWMEAEQSFSKKGQGGGSTSVSVDLTALM